MQLNLKQNFPDVARALARLSDDVAQRALASALNRTMDQARTEMTRQITREYAVSRAYVRQRLRVSRASYKGGTYTMRAELIGGDGRRRSANVIAFVERSVSLAQAKRRAKAGTLGQLFVEIRRGAKKPLQDAFVGNRGRTVFERVPGTVMASRSRYKGTQHAEQIVPVRTIDVPQMFNASRINRVVVAKVEAKFPEIFEREARHFTARFNAR